MNIILNDHTGIPMFPTPWPGRMYPYPYQNPLIWENQRLRNENDYLRGEVRRLRDALTYRPPHVPVHMPLPAGW